MIALTTPVAPFVNWSLLGRVFLISLGAGVGMVILFSIGLATLSLARDDGRSALQRMSARTVSTVMALAIVTALVWGLVLILKKG